MKRSKSAIFFWMFLFSVCGVIGYLEDHVWMMVVGGLGVLFYAYASRTKTTFLHLAIEQWEVPDVMKLIKEGADVDAKDWLGNSPLHVAARSNKSVMAKVLIDAGATVDMKNSSGHTPLHWAAAHNAREATEMLILHGADVSLKNKDGRTPFARAVANGHFDLAIYLEQQSIR